MLHRNSQKRYYRENLVYFITTNTHDRYPFFSEGIFCYLFIEDLEFCMDLKRCRLFGYKINPDHVHLLIRPDGDANYSDIMGSLKRNFARDCNALIMGGDFIARRRGFESPPSGITTPPPEKYLLEHYDRVRRFHDMYMRKYPGTPPYPRFQWQSSFHDHIIRDERDFRNHVNYLRIQWIRHHLTENNWLWVDVPP